MDSKFDKPKGLSAKGEAAYKAIMELFQALEDATPEYPLSSGGCVVFYSPEEWKARGERYGRDAELIIVYDGGDHGMYFSHSYECYEAIEKMRLALEKVGVYTEECTHWYSGVYSI